MRSVCSSVSLMEDVYHTTWLALLLVAALLSQQNYRAKREQSSNPASVSGGRLERAVFKHDVSATAVASDGYRGHKGTALRCLASRRTQVVFKICSRWDGRLG